MSSVERRAWFTQLYGVVSVLYNVAKILVRLELERENLYYYIIMSDYAFFNLGRIGADEADQTQRNLHNTRFSNYNLSNYFNENTSNAHVDFATTYPNMMFVGNKGIGLGGNIDVDSNLHLKMKEGRSLEKLSLNERPFLTVPYLGRGSVDPVVESRLMMGENVFEPKSTSTIMSRSFMDYTMYHVDDEMKSRVSDPKKSVEEYALDGWVRGGVMTREMMTDEDFKRTARPLNKL
jgi:hypothetical protein